MRPKIFEFIAFLSTRPRCERQQSAGEMAMEIDLHSNLESRF